MVITVFDFFGRQLTGTVHPQHPQHPQPLLWRCLGPQFRYPKTHLHTQSIIRHHTVLSHPHSIFCGKTSKTSNIPQYPLDKVPYLPAFTAVIPPHYQPSPPTAVPIAVLAQISHWVCSVPVCRSRSFLPVYCITSFNPTQLELPTTSRHHNSRSESAIGYYEDADANVLLSSHALD